MLATFFSMRDGFDMSEGDVLPGEVSHRGYRSSLTAMNPAATAAASPAAVLFPVVAHQGGWDEILLVALPLAAIGGLLWIANRRVDAKLRAGEAQREASSDIDAS